MYVVVIVCEDLIKSPMWKMRYDLFDAKLSNRDISITDYEGSRFVHFSEWNPNSVQCQSIARMLNVIYIY